MRNFTMILILAAIFLVAGCNGGADSNKAEATKTEASAPAAETPAAETPAAETPAAETLVAVHDCDGGCGMKDVAMENLTEIDGKFYCMGCAKHAAAPDSTGHGH